MAVARPLGVGTWIARCARRTGVRHDEVFAPLIKQAANTRGPVIIGLDDVHHADVAGLTYGDVRVVYAPPDRAEALFASGRVDAWATWEPFLGNAIRARTARILRSARGLTANTGYYVGARSFVTENPALVSLFLGQLREVTRWAEVQPGQAAAMLAAELDLPPLAASASLLNIRAPEPFDVAHTLAQQNIADTFYRLGIVDTRIDVKRACWRHPASVREHPLTRGSDPSGTRETRY